MGIYDCRRIRKTSHPWLALFQKQGSVYLNCPFLHYDTKKQKWENQRKVDLHRAVPTNI